MFKPLDCELKTKIVLNKIKLVNKIKYDFV